MSSVTGIKVGDEKTGKSFTWFVHSKQSGTALQASLSIWTETLFLYALKASKGDVGKGRNIGGNHFVKDV